MNRLIRGHRATVSRRAVLLAVTALPALLLAACTPVKPYLPEPTQAPFGQGRAWRIDGPGIAASYVFATFDLPDKRVLELPAAAEQAFERSEVVAFDVLIDPYIQAELYDKESSQLTGDETLEELIGARSFGILTWHMKQRQRRPNNRIKPWAMWSYLGGENFGFVDYDFGVDNRSDKNQAHWLEDRAETAGKKVVGLQTDQENFDVYDKMPLDQQADMLKVRLDRYEGLSPQVRKMQLYLDGDLARLDALWREYLSWLQPATAETLDRRMITDRNRLMVERMLPLMQEQSTFVAVGFGHLPGEQGILRLLEQRGFVVTRVY